MLRQGERGWRRERATGGDKGEDQFRASAHVEPARSDDDETPRGSCPLDVGAMRRGLSRLRPAL